MAITTYTELKAAVLDWIARPELTSQVVDFIRLAELDFAPTLRAKVLRASITLAEADAGVVALPADVGELRSIRFATDTYQHAINLVTVETLADFRRNATGVPIWGAVVGTTLLLAPAPSTDFAAELVYFEKLVPLSNASPSNNTLADAPNVYLYGALAQAEMYLEHDERIDLWQSRTMKAVADLNNQREQAELAGSPRSMRLPRAIG